MKPVVYSALIAILALSFAASIPFSHASGASTVTNNFVLDASQSVFTCGETDNGLIQNPASPPTATTVGNAYGYGFCSTAPFSGSNTISIQTVSITIYLEATLGTPAAAGLVSGNMKDYSNSNQIYTFSDQSYTAGVSCTANTFTVTGTFSPLIPGDNLLANFNFAAAGVAVYPTLCTGSGQESLITITGIPTIPTPEFPLGTVLSIIAPLGAIVSYVFLTSKFRKSLQTSHFVEVQAFF